MASTRKKTEEPGQLTTELNAEQALGLVSYTLMQRLAAEGQSELPLLDNDQSSHAGMAKQLRQRLELTALAIESGAPSRPMRSLISWVPGREPNPLSAVASGPVE